jgi:cell division protease FtsH
MEEKVDNHKRKQIWMAWYVVTAVLGILFVHQIWDSAKQTEAIPYSEFDQLVSSHKIAEAIVGSDMIEGKLKEPASDGKTKFVTVRVDPAIADKLAAEGVKVSGAPPTGFIGTILASTVPAIILYFLWILLFRRFAGGQALPASRAWANRALKSMSKRIQR